MLVNLCDGVACGGMPRRVVCPGGGCKKRTPSIYRESALAEKMSFLQKKSKKRLFFHPEPKNGCIMVLPPPLP